MQAGTPWRASLLAKVWDQFAEFLNQGSLVRVTLLSQPTSVGVRYGQYVAPAQAFPASSGVGDLQRGLRHPPVLASQLAPTSLNGPRLTTRHPPQDLTGSLPVYWCRNINLLSIAYAFPPRLRPD